MERTAGKGHTSLFVLRSFAFSFTLSNLLSPVLPLFGSLCSYISTPFICTTSNKFPFFFFVIVLVRRSLSSFCNCSFFQTISSSFSFPSFFPDPLFPPPLPSIFSSSSLCQLFYPALTLLVFTRPENMVSFLSKALFLSQPFSFFFFVSSIPSSASQLPWSLFPSSNSFFTLQVTYEYTTLYASRWWLQRQAAHEVLQVIKFRSQLFLFSLLPWERDARFNIVHFAWKVVYSGFGRPRFEWDRERDRNRERIVEISSRTWVSAE